MYHVQWKRSILLFLLAIVTAVFVVACSSETPAAIEEPAATPTAVEEVEESEEEVVEEVVEEEVVEEVTEVTVTHYQGESTVPFNPQRVVVLDYSVLDTLDQLGLSDQIVGVMQGETIPSHLADYNGDQYTHVGTFFEPDFEAINALQPDLVIVASRSSSFYSEFAETYPTIDATVGWEGQYEAFQSYVNNIGTIFGKEEEVTERLAEIDAHVAEVKAMAEASGYQGLIVMTSGGEVTGYGPGSRFGLIHDALGVAPTTDTMVAETHGDSISFEFILEQNPDIIFVIDRDAAIGQEGGTAVEILDNELVNSTTAGANGNIVYLDPTLWYLADTGLYTLDARVAQIKEGLEAALANDGGGSEETSQETGDGVRTVVDLNGDEIVIEDDSRIITLEGPVTEIVYALGAGDRIIATDSSSTYPEAATQLPQVGYVRQLSAEPVLALDPTLILTTDQAGPPEAVEQLRESGVTVVQFPSAASVEESYALIRNIAAALDLEEKGEELIAKMEADLAEAAALLEQVETTPRVLFIYARGVDTVMGGGLGTGVDVILEMAGAENAITEFEGYQPLTAEAAVTAAPDAYLLFTSGLASVGGPEGLLQIPGLGQTPAGENQQVFAMDGLLLTGFGPRVGEAVLELIHLLHPEMQ